MANVEGTKRSVRCPSWCARRHETAADVGDTVHVGGALQVRRTLLRLVTAVEPGSGAEDGPFVLVGQDEYTLHEADVLIAALTQLVDEARQATALAVPQMRPPGP